jgi:ribosomal protein S18 acetylase RimI-like enzyme
MPLGDPGLKEFVKFPWRLYKNDPCWTPPLNMDLLGNKLLGATGLLTPKHPYHKHAEVTHFLAWRDKKPVGRISAAINRRFNEYHQTNLGFFGFFDVINDYEVASTLLDKAKEWVAARGLSAIRGPGEYSNATHERQGILIDGFQYRPTVDLTHNFPYYSELLERYGFRKVKDYLAYLIDRKDVDMPFIQKLARKARKMVTMETRALNYSELVAEVRLIVDIYNAAWANNWGFLPITGEEGDAIADALRLIIDPGLVRFGYVDGKPAAVLGMIPDPNYALRPLWKWYGDSDMVRIIRLLQVRRRIPHIRGWFFGIKPEYRNLGIPVILFDELFDYFIKHHYLQCDGSLLLEDNEQIISIVDMFGGKYYKRWRIYEMPLK